MEATPRSTTYYSVRAFMKTGYQDTSFFDEGYAKKFAAMFVAPYDAIVRSSTCGPIKDGFTPYADSSIINYEIDCGCHVTVWDGRKSIDRCFTPDCHDPELCIEHPNFFTQAYVEMHARKFYL